MEVKSGNNWIFLPHGWRFFIICLLVISVFFRLFTLDKKAYLYDENITLLRLSGYTHSEVIQQVFDGHIIRNEDLQRYQRINPEKNLGDTIKSLAIEASEHPPLYFMMVRFWVQWFGNSVAITRSLSALISLLTFPCIYWLCLELFGSSLTGWIAIALIAISPFHLVYAQQARSYSLWTVTILLSSAALLRAIRLKTKMSWIIYAVTVALGFYSFSLTVLSVIGHGIYVLMLEGFRLSKTLTFYLFASLAGLLTFVPWLLVIIANFSASSVLIWTAKKISLKSLFKYWILNLSRLFVDLEFSSKTPLKISYLISPILILVGYSIYFIFRNAPSRIWLFILALIGMPTLILALPDLFLGGHRSSVSRYSIPSYLGIELAVTYLFTTKFIYISAKIWQQKLWQIALIALISSGILSCAISSQAKDWWTTYHENENIIAARIVNQADFPLVISDAAVGNLLSFSYLLAPKVRLQLMVEPEMSKISNDFKNVFLFNPSKRLQNRLEAEQNFKVKSVYKGYKASLWELEA